MDVAMFSSSLEVLSFVLQKEGNGVEDCISHHRYPGRYIASQHAGATSPLHYEDYPCPSGAKEGDDVILSSDKEDNDRHNY